MDPVSDTDFTSQLAQFSTLQGINTLNTNFSDLLSLQQLTQGSSLVGHSVVYTPSGSNSAAQGTVQGISIQNGSLQLSVGGASVPLSSVQSVQ